MSLDFDDSGEGCEIQLKAPGVVELWNQIALGHRDLVANAKCRFAFGNAQQCFESCKTC